MRFAPSRLAPRRLDRRAPEPHPARRRATRHPPRRRSGTLAQANQREPARQRSRSRIAAASYNHHCRHRTMHFNLILEHESNAWRLLGTTRGTRRPGEDLQQDQPGRRDTPDDEAATARLQRMLAIPSRSPQLRAPMRGIYVRARIRHFSLSPTSDRRHQCASHARSGRKQVNRSHTSIAALCRPRATTSGARQSVCRDGSCPGGPPNAGEAAGGGRAGQPICSASSMMIPSGPRT